MIAPVTFADLPDALVQPVNDVTGLLPGDGAPYNVDQWDGYTADRREVLTHLDDHQVKDTVFLTGDIHSAWACELPLDTSTYPVVGDSLGVEFVCTSVTSNNLKDITGTPPDTTSTWWSRPSWPTTATSSTSTSTTTASRSSTSPPPAPRWTGTSSGPRRPRHRDHLVGLLRHRRRHQPDRAGRRPRRGDA